MLVAAVDAVDAVAAVAGDVSAAQPITASRRPEPIPTPDQSAYWLPQIFSFLSHPARFPSRDAVQTLPPSRLSRLRHFRILDTSKPGATAFVLVLFLPVDEAGGRESARRPITSAAALG